MFKEWLKRKMTIEECEREHLVEDERLGSAPVPFGFQHQAWLNLKHQIKMDDELWEFSSPPESWEHLCGRAGICIVRDGEIFDSIVTVMN